MSSPVYCPTCHRPLPPDAALCVGCGTLRGSGRQLTTRLQAATPEADLPAGWRAGDPEHERILRRIESQEQQRADLDRAHFRSDYVLPAILASLGLFLVLIDALVLKRWVWQISPFAQSLSQTTVIDSAWRYTLLMLGFSAARITLQFPLLLAGLLFTAWFFGAAYGYLGSVLIKLMAVALLIGGLGDVTGSLLDLGTGGMGFIAWMLQGAVAFGAFYALCATLFEMDKPEILVLFGLMIVLPLLLLGLLLGVGLALFSP